MFACSVCYSQMMHAPPDPPEQFAGPPPIPPDLLLSAYRAGIFPMAESRDDPDVFWVEPQERAIVPLDSFRPSKSLRKVLRQGRYRVTLNTAFLRVVQACAAPRIETSGPDEGCESGSWISHRIEASYLQLYRIGHAHSVECWIDRASGPKLAGGLYGVSFDRVFCGESMFSRADNASKVALAWLVAAMRRGEFALLDCQFMTDHLASLGAVELPQAEYVARLSAARPAPGEAHRSYSLSDSFASLLSDGAASPGKLIAQSFTQTS